ncbi:hypothetical protein DS987_25700 [Escherichia coli]|nr:hypothetical protein DS987_25700 [Escherichia coli]
MKLGFIGLGIMGTPMAINLARAGHQLHVTTIGPVADELLSLGAVSVETAHQVTEASDIIFIMVPDTPQVEEVLFGENGCTKASLKGKTIVDMSSISPIETKEGANKRGNSSRLTQSFHFFMFEPIFSPVNALNQPI